jgi:hypothetical protein
LPGLGLSRPGNAPMKWTRTRDGDQWVSGTYRITGLMIGGYRHFVARSGDKFLCEVGTLAAAKDWCAKVESKHYSRLIINDPTDGYYSPPKG